MNNQHVQLTIADPSSQAILSTSFTAHGEIADRRFIPLRVDIAASSLESQEAVQHFLATQPQGLQGLLVEFSVAGPS